MKTIQIGEMSQPGQLTVLLSPRKLSLVVMGKMDEQSLGELIDLGLGLAKEI